ncbi:MAG: outer membrane protein assembly factor BamA, partial [Nitrospirota bacterium]
MTRRRRAGLGRLGLVGLLGVTVCAAGVLLPHHRAAAAEPDPSGRPGPADIIVKRIDIQGLRKIAETTVRSKLPLREGDRFTVDGVRKIIQEVHRLGYFEDVQVATEGFEGGLRLVVTVKEWPVVRDIRYEGYDELSLDKLKEQVSIRAGSFLDLRALTNATRGLTTYYRNQGYFQAEVIPLLQELRPGEAAVTFVIREGGRARVRSVSFAGNHAASERQLRKAVETTRYFWLTSWLTDSGLYQDDRAAQDVERVRDYYLDRGYLQVQVGEPQVSLSEDQRWFDVVFSIVEGDQYTISSVTFSGVTLFTEAEVRAVVETAPGELFRRSRIRADILAVTDLYGERGYAFAQVLPDIRPDAAAKRAAIEFQVQEGEQIRVRRIDIAGNLKTRDKVIRRELRVQEQEILNTKALKRSFERLNNLNFFESVEVAPTTRPPDQVDLEVRVKEKPTGTFSIGGGYSSVDRFVGLVEIT